MRRPQVGRWLAGRIPRVTSRAAIIALVLILGLILGSGLAIVSLLGKVDSTATTAKGLAADSKTKTRQIQALVSQLHDLVDRNHRQRLADQAQTDRQLRDIICTFVAIDTRARARLLPLLPARYARERCTPQTAHHSLGPQASESPAPPGAVNSVPVRPAITHTTTARTTISVTVPRPSPTRTSQPPILDTPGLLCQLERSLGLRCTP